VSLREGPHDGKTQTLALFAYEGFLAHEDLAEYFFGHARTVVVPGIYLLRDSVLREFPDRTPLSLEQDVFPELTSRRTLLKVETMNTPFLDIGTPESLPLAGDFIRRNREQFATA
jgi:NDP-sugar pyrophosphorylase family protein